MPTAINWELADLAWVIGLFFISYATGWGAGNMHRSFVQIMDRIT